MRSDYCVEKMKIFYWCVIILMSPKGSGKLFLLLRSLLLQIPISHTSIFFINFNFMKKRGSNISKARSIWNLFFIDSSMQSFVFMADLFVQQLTTKNYLLQNHISNY